MEMAHQGKALAVQEGLEFKSLYPCQMLVTAVVSYNPSTVRAGGRTAGDFSRLPAQFQVQ